MTTGAAAHPSRLAVKNGEHLRMTEKQRMVTKSDGYAAQARV
jgi:hypothetical protein